MAFTFEQLEIPDVVKVTPDVFGDDRGFFLEIFKESAFKEGGIDEQFVQVNHSKSGANVLRGLHYQLDPHAQGKLITVISGEVFDVTVDVRKSSSTFGKWVGTKLTAADHTMVYVPVGFAHGFAVLGEGAELIYYNTKEYAQEHERGIIWNDPALGIEWPITDPTLSEKDAVYPPLAEAEMNFE